MMLTYLLLGVQPTTETWLQGWIDVWVRAKPEDPKVLPQQDLEHPMRDP